MSYLGSCMTFEPPGLGIQILTRVSCLGNCSSRCFTEVHSSTIAVFVEND